MTDRIATTTETMKFFRLNKVTCEMWWKPGKSESAWDLDLSLCVLNKRGEIIKEISYLNREDSNEFYYSGDNSGKDYAGELTSEKIKINFSELPANYSRIIIMMNIYDAIYKRQDLSMVKEIELKIWDSEIEDVQFECPIKTNKISFMENMEFLDKTGMIVAEFMKVKGGKWIFRLIGESVPRIDSISDLKELIAKKYVNNTNSKKTWKDFLEELYPHKSLIRRLLRL